MIFSKIRKWWEDPAYDNKQPMVFPDKAKGRSKPVKVVGPCAFPEECRCSSSRVFICKCSEGDRYTCRCSHV